MYTWHSLLHTHDELLAASVHVARIESKTGKQDILMVVICCLTALPGIRSKVRKLNPIWTLNKMGPQKKQLARAWHVRLTKILKRRWRTGGWHGSTVRPFRRPAAEPHPPLVAADSSPPSKAMIHTLTAGLRTGMTCNAELHGICRPRTHNRGWLETTGLSVRSGALSP